MVRRLQLPRVVCLALATMSAACADDFLTDGATRTQALPERWGKLYSVRSALSLAALVIFVVELLRT